MQKRLISQNILQCQNQSVAEFASFASLVAYRTTDNTIKLKQFNKDSKQLQIKFASNKEVRRNYFCTYVGRIFFVLEFSENCIEIYEVEVQGIEVKAKCVEKLDNAAASVGLTAGIAFVQDGRVVKLAKFQNYLYNSKNSLLVTSICQCPSTPTIIPHQGTQIFVMYPHQTPDTKIIRIFSPNSTGTYEQNPLHIDYIKQPLAIYRDQYIFQECKATKEIEIFNVALSKIIGKFSYEGDIVGAFVRADILLVITTRENMDRYCFYSLNADITAKSIFSHRSVYEKGKGTYFQTFYCDADFGQQITQGKQINYTKQLEKKQQQIKQGVLLIYVQVAKKAKIQITRVSTNKIKDQAFKENEMDTIILCKTEIKQKGQSQKKVRAEKQLLQIQKARVNASMNHRKSEKSVQQIQRRMIDHIVDIKIKGLLDKFQELQKRLCRIEDQIVIIYAKIQSQMSKINHQQIRRSVENLFQKVTPQFQSYFNEVFRQISGVLDQGVYYYNMKLAKESQIHKEAFSQIINMTFDAAKQIVQLGRKQLQQSQKTSDNIQKLLQIKSKWQAQSMQMAQNFKTYRMSVEGNHQISLNPNPISPEKKSPPQTKKN